MSQPGLAAVSGADQKRDHAACPPGIVCPSCRGKLIRRSMRRTLLDRVMSAFGRWPYRCVLCNTRFLGESGIPERKS